MDAPEEWKNLPAELGFSAYEVSTEGRIRKRDGYVLKSKPRATGYLYSRLSKDGGGYEVLGNHQIVAHAFLPPDASRGDVDHIDRDRMNNKPSNLRRVTSQENSQNRSAPKSKKPTKAVDQLSLEGTVLKTWSGARVAAAELGIHSSSITQCCIGNAKTTGGFGWRYTPQDVPGADEEIWIDVLVNDTTVGASSLGRVRLQRTITKGTIGVGRPTVQVVDAKGKAHRHFVHTIICSAFRGPRPFPDAKVRHIDHDFANNREENLEWASLVDVLKDRNPSTSEYGRPVEQLSFDGELIAVHKSIAAGADAVEGAYGQNISCCCRGTKASSGGFAWRYAPEP
jgi:hypothetical protein